MHCFGESPGNFLSRNALQHAPDLIRIESPQDDAAIGGHSSQLGQRRGQRVISIYFYISICPDNQEPRPGQVTGNVGQHIQGTLFGIVQVFQDNEQRLDTGGVDKESGNCLQQPVSFLFRVFLRSQFYLEPLPYFGNDARHVCSTSAQLLPQVFDVAAEHIGAQSFYKSQIGQR